MRECLAAKPGRSTSQHIRAQFWISYCVVIKASQVSRQWSRDWKDHIVAVTTDSGPELLPCLEKRLRTSSTWEVPKPIDRCALAYREIMPALWLCLSTLTIDITSHNIYRTKDLKALANTYFMRKFFQCSSKAESFNPPPYSVGSSGRDTCRTTPTESATVINRAKSTRLRKLTLAHLCFIEESTMSTMPSRSQCIKWDDLDTALATSG